MNFIKKHWALLIVILVGLTPIVWFLGKPGFIINGLDTNFPLDPLLWFGRRMFVWYGLSNAGSNFSSSTSGLFFHFIQALPYFLKFKIQIVEIISFIFWFMAIAGSAFIFAKGIIPNSKLGQLVFVILYSFNIYLFNTWENVKVSNLALMVGIPLFLAILIFYVNKKINLSKVFSFSVIASLVCLGAGINPAYFMTLIGSIIIFSSLYLVIPSSKASRKEIIIATIVCLLSILAVNLFWMLPLLKFLVFTKGSVSLTDLGFSNWIKSLSENTSIDNIIRYQGAWDWYVLDVNGIPLYIPYAAKYFYNQLFILFSFAVPTLAIISLALSKKGNGFYYCLFAILSVLGIFLGVGVHPPTGYLYEFLAAHLPFFSFFRSPWYIFTPYLIIGFSSLVALLVDRSESFIKSRVLRFGIVSVFIICHLFYSFPLVTGGVFRTDRSDSFYIKVPSYVYQAKSWLDSNDIDRIAVYPNDQLEGFIWGYRGTDSILGILTNREFISPSFNVVSENYASIVSTFYTYFAKGELESAISVSKMLSINSVMVKNDSTSFPVKVNKDSLSKVFDLNTFGLWDFYQFRAEAKSQKIFSPDFVYKNYGAADVSPLISPLISGKFLSVLPVDSQTSAINASHFGSLIEAKNSLSDNDKIKESQTYDLSIDRDGVYKITVERKGLKGIEIAVDGKPYRTGITSESYFSVGGVQLSKGIHNVLVNYPKNENIVPAEDYSKYSDNSGLRKEDLPENKVKTLALYNESGNDIRFSIPINNFDTFATYLYSADYKYFYGWKAGVDVVQKSGDNRLRLYPIYYNEISKDWQTIKNKISLAQADSTLEIDFTLPRNGWDSKSKSFMENISLKKIYDNRVFAIRNSDEVAKPPKLNFKKVSPVEYEIEASDVVSPYFIVFSENYDSNWELSSGNKSNFPHFSANSYANGWYVSDTNGTQKLRIYYKPQTLFNIGFVIFSSSLVVAVGLLMIGLIRKNEK